ncbi:hypothetical protein CTheo_2720 [Ceratobasidium theobromae]|uniref:CUE domain-containing protein n=1 Tax=Ceratobasidium theobromae TaxID=1582974 RepID=A0A5N5QQH3_9AGAM|nr:hypothetical protein CTheo_2720 [Ceratobasidium theobromae]
MAVANSLPIFPIHELKNSIPRAKYDNITRNVACKLLSILESATKSNKGPQAQILTCFLSSYLSDVARQVLVRTSTGVASSYVDLFSDSERIIRKCILRLVSLLASQQADLPVALLVDLAVAYYPSNKTVVLDIFNKTLSVAPQASRFSSGVLSALVSALSPNLPNIAELREVAHTLLCLSSCGNEAISLLARNPSFVKAMVECYQIVLPKLLESHGGIHLEGGRSPSEALCMDAKVDLLESYYNIVYTLAKSTQDADLAFQIIFQASEVPNQPTTTSIPFFNTSINDDLNRVVNLTILFDGSVLPDDPRLEVIKSQLDPTPLKPDIGALAVLPTPTRKTPVTATTARIDKGKSKQTNIEPAPDPELGALVDQVLEILPEQDPVAVRAGLQLPRFNRSAETLISALLEGEQLLDLVQEQNVPPPASKSVIPERRNVFDDDEMDYSRLRIGKKRSENADTILNDKSFIAIQKAEIIRRAAEVSDEDSEWKSDEEKKPVAMAFFEDDDEYGGGAMVNDGEATSEGESGDENEAEGGPETALELAWLEDAQVFERDANTRRSKSRADLKGKTGWSDEQIEGWKVMLDRDSRLQAKIRQKHEFKGNQPLLPPTQQYDAPRGGRGRGGRGRGRGGRGGRGGGGRGGGSGEGGGPSNADGDRAYKDRNKANHANHDRKRGHDKKMARGGFAG